MADAGQVNVRFSVSDAEVVRQALEKLGKDGEQALKRLDAAAQLTNNWHHGRPGAGAWRKTYARRGQRLNRFALS